MGIDLTTQKEPWMAPGRHDVRIVSGFQKEQDGDREVWIWKLVNDENEKAYISVIIQDSTMRLLDHLAWTCGLDEDDRKDLEVEDLVGCELHVVIQDNEEGFPAVRHWVRKKGDSWKEQHKNAS